MHEERRPRVLLADDYQGLLDAWRRLLESSCDIVGSVLNGRDVLEAATRLRPDVIVLDVDMPGLNGVDACRQIKQATPETGVVLVTAADDADVRHAGTQAGASAFVLKYSAAEELERAIQRAFAGDTIA